MIYSRNCLRIGIRKHIEGSLTAYSLTFGKVGGNMLEIPCMLDRLEAEHALGQLLEKPK